MLGLAGYGPWVLINARPSPELEHFLRQNEPVATVMSDRYLRYPLDRRGKRGGRFHFHKNAATLYQGPGGFFFPARLGRFSDDPETNSGLRRRLGSFVRIRTVMGTNADVEALIALVGTYPGESVEYELLRLTAAAVPPIPPPPIADLFLEQPPVSEWRSLLDLQMAYEREEVLLPGRLPIAAHSKAHLIESLTSQVVLVARRRGTVVARVATNARGFQTDQIGGVFTDPALRGRGIARWLMIHLLHRLAREQRNASLYVKCSNRAARRLYQGLGFEFVSPFRISYYG